MSHTPEQVSDAHMKLAARALESIARQECPHCASRNLIEIGRSVYCDACGARLYLGKLFRPMPAGPPEGGPNG